MGYDSTFYGGISIEPPLNAAEVDYLTRFSLTRRMHRRSGPYYADSDPCAGSDFESPEVVNYNVPHPGQPGLWCDFVPTPDGKAIEWNGNEKTYDAAEWIQYLIDHFLAPGAKASRSGDKQFEAFTFNHILNGRLQAECERQGDVGAIVVENNRVR